MNLKKIKVWIKSLKEEQIRDWLKYFLGMGFVLTIIVFVMSLFHGEPPLYVHGFAALEAAIFASLATLIKNKKLFKKKELPKP